MNMYFTIKLLFQGYTLETHKNYLAFLLVNIWILFALLPRRYTGKFGPDSQVYQEADSPADSDGK